MAQRLLKYIEGTNAIAEATDSDVAGFLASALATILTKGSLTLDGNGNGAVMAVSNPALVNILSGSVVTLRPGAGWSNMNLVVTISPGSGFSIASAGGNLDAGLVVGYTVFF